MNVSEIRNSKKGRLWIIGGLITLALVALYFIKGTAAKVIIGSMIAVLLVAFGMEAKGTDYDMGKLIETKSFAKAKTPVGSGKEQRSSFAEETHWS